MKFAGIIFLIATIVYFLIKWKKTGNIKSETNKTGIKKGDEKKKTDDNAGGAGYLKKNRKSLIIWAIILQFIVLNLIYPGEWFEVKKIFWFFAPKISGRYLALKEYKDIIETDKKKKLSDIQNEIRKFEQAKNLSTDDINKLNNLTRRAEKINDVYKEKPTKPAPAKPARWIFQILADPEVIIRARAKRVNQAPLTEFNLNYFSKTDNELRFRYKTPTGKTVDVLLNKRSLNDSHYFGMADLPDPPKGRKMMLWLKNNDRDDGFEGTTVTWDGSRWYPTVTAFLKRTS